MPRGEWHHPNLVKAYYDEITTRLEDSCWDPPRPPLNQNLTYFGNVVDEQKRKKEYDLFFSYMKTFPLWDQRKNKDNRLFLPDVRKNVFEQEYHKPFPVVTSMVYGRPCRVPYDMSDPSYRRLHSMGDFYRRTGVMRVKERKPT